MIINLLAELKARVGTPGAFIVLLGNTALNDGFGGVFYWDDSAVGADTNDNVSVTGQSNGRWKRLNPVTVQPNIKTGNITVSGTTLLTTINIPHGVGAKPTYFSVTPKTTAAKAIESIDADATNIIVKYTVAVPVGTNNLAYSWIAIA